MKLSKIVSLLACTALFTGLPAAAIGQDANKPATPPPAAGANNTPPPGNKPQNAQPPAQDASGQSGASGEKPKVQPPDSKTVATDNDAIYKNSLGALTILFVVAVLLENALAVIFNWRVFLAFFSLRGVKTIVTVIVSLIVVNAFHLDVVANLIAVYRSSGGVPAPADSSSVSIFLTALILSGGSSGVNNIMAALGFRTNQREDELVARPPKDKAWVAIRLNRVTMQGTVVVAIDEVPAGDPRVATAKAVAGTIGTKRTSLSELLFRNVNRFPQSGGYTVEPGKVYDINLTGKDAGGNDVAHPIGVYKFAPGAIVDFDATW